MGKIWVYLLGERKSVGKLETSKRAESMPQKLVQAEIQHEALEEGLALDRTL